MSQKVADVMTRKPATVPERGHDSGLADISAAEGNT